MLHTVNASSNPLKSYIFQDHAIKIRNRVVDTTKISVVGRDHVDQFRWIRIRMSRSFTDPVPDPETEPY
jgi:hypothetical protein